MWVFRWVLMVLIGTAGVCAAHAATVRVGVLAFQGVEAATARWQSTVDYFQQKIPEHRFELRPLSYEDLNEEIKNARLDFVFTNPEHYVVLRNVYGLRPMATLSAKLAGKVVDNYGSAIFTRADQVSIRELSDVKKARVAAVGLYSLAGFLMAADEFMAVGIDLLGNDIKSLQFTGVPHSKVVEEVLAGRADVGIVRSGVLERMIDQGRMTWRDIRVLNLKPPSYYPQAVSTALYPEWPFAASAQVDPNLIRQLTVALLQIPADSVAAQKGGYVGFLPPANYAPVEMLMRRLNIYPDVEEKPLLRLLWSRYSQQAQWAMGAGFMGLIALAFWLYRHNRRLRTLTRLYEDARPGLQVTAAAFSSQVGLVVTDEATRIIRANPAFCEMFGFDERALIGKNTAMLRSPAMPMGSLRRIWPRLQKKGQWQGELIGKRHSGENITCAVTISRIAADDLGIQGYVGSFVDVSEQKAAESQIRQLAYYDNLTELPNRRLFLERLSQVMASRRAEAPLGALLFIDLDHFKVLNDTHGHVVGDQLLRDIALRLNRLMTEDSMAARLGGDEFVVMLCHLAREPVEAIDKAMAFAHRVRSSILAPYRLDAPSETNLSESVHLHYNCTGSIGVALFGQKDEAISEVLKRADVAMYQSKHAGRNAVSLFDPQVQKQIHDRLALSGELNVALERGELFLLYQLQVDSQGRPVGAEGLLRWKHPSNGMISPVEFIPLAEESGVILPIGEWVLRQACSILVRWSSQPGFECLPISVNVSPRQFTDTDFVPKLQRMLQETGVQPGRLMLEITEGIVLQNTEQVIEKMQSLCAIGVKFSIDDFGTGYSSLSYLQRLPLREVKIDRAFIRDLVDNKNSEAIVRAIVALGASMDLQVVSEGVENEEQKMRLIDLGCNALQGYLIGKPVMLDDLEALVRTRTAFSVS